MSTKVISNEQHFKVLDTMLDDILDVIAKHVSDKTEEEITVEELREVINKPTGRTVSVAVSSAAKANKEVPPGSRCCKPVTGKSAKDICGKQISREGGIFCAACRKLKTLNVIAKDILEERGMTLWEATAGAQGVEPSKKASRYEDDEDEDDDDEDEEEVEEKVTKRKVIKKTPPNARLVEAAKKKRVLRK